MASTASSATVQLTSPTPTLQTLPPEVRSLIFEHCFFESELHLDCKSRPYLYRATSYGNSILLVCRQFYLEALATYYNHILVVIPWNTWTRVCGQYAGEIPINPAKHVRRICVSGGSDAAHLRSFPRYQDLHKVLLVDEAGGHFCKTGLPKDTPDSAIWDSISAAADDQTLPLAETIIELNPQAEVTIHTSPQFCVSRGPGRLVLVSSDSSATKADSTALHC